MSRLGPDNKDKDKDKDSQRINEQITTPKIRLIDAQGTMIGIISTREALQKAYSEGLDLVEISPHVNPPVCKILDFGKLKYEQQKKKAEAKKKQKTIEIKEIQLRPMINDHDLQVKMKAMERFLSDGNKVKITMRYRGREMSHQEIGVNVLNKIRTEFSEKAKVELEPKMEGKQIIMIMGPIQQK